jgi:predicted membrane-bound dolichyl-phosphate-mannose-protein mannosyltransferase
VPSPDAAAKPVAGVHVFGVPLLTAASLVTAAAAAAVVVLAALLAAKVGRSPWAGAAAGVLLLASPSLGFWSGFSGPDPLSQALALAAALALVNRRPVAGGALAGLAIATRPELALVALAAAAVAWRSGDWRSDLRRAAPATVVTLALVYGTLRPPVALPDVKLVVLAVVALCCLLVVASRLPPWRGTRS